MCKCILNKKALLFLTNILVVLHNRIQCVCVCVCVWIKHFTKSLHTQEKLKTNQMTK